MLKHFKFFVSHSSSDLELVLPFCKFLRNAANVSLDEIFCTSLEHRVLSNDRYFFEEIRQAIFSAEVIIFLVTKNFLLSRSCLMEMGMAYYPEKKRVIFLDDGLSHTDLPPFLSGIQVFGHFDVKNLVELKVELFPEATEREIHTNVWLDEVNCFLDNIRNWKTQKKHIEGTSLFVEETNAQLKNELEAKNKQIQNLLASLKLLERFILGINGGLETQGMLNGMLDTTKETSSKDNEVDGRVREDNEIADETKTVSYEQIGTDTVLPGSKQKRNTVENDIQIKYARALSLEGQGKNDEAFKLYLECAVGGHANAQLHVAWSYQYGLGVGQNADSAFEWYEKSAANGNAAAQNNLAHCYENGIGTDVNVEKALYYYSESSKQGICEATHALGVIYFSGILVAKDHEKAVGYFKQAAALNHSESIFTLAYCYEFGYGVPKNPDLAWENYIKAADLGELLAIERVAIKYEEGDLVERNIDESMRWYELGVSKGSLCCMNNLAFMLQDGLHGAKKDEHRALQLYIEAAEKGNLPSQNNLGWTYEHGIGTQINIEKAVYWYEKAKENDNDAAWLNMGRCYQYGIGVAMDERKAYEHYRKAAELNNTKAKYRLGYCLQYGVGCDINLSEAFSFYMAAADKGNADAQCSVGVFYYQGMVVEENVEIAKEWFEKAVEQKHVVAEYYLALYYLMGMKVSQDEKKAHNLLIDSARSGCDEARTLLKRLGIKW